MSKLKENTDLKEPTPYWIRTEKGEFEPLYTKEVIEKLVHQARENAVEKLQRVFEAEQEKLHQSLMRFADEQYKKGFAEGVDMAQELESKEEA